MHRLVEVAGQSGAAVGFACAMADPFAAELLADSGPDFIMVDCQHGLLGRDETVRVLQALRGSDVCVIVRVAGNRADLIGAALDCGADGVIVPLVSSVPDAERALAASCYPPSGSRSFGPIRSYSQLLRGSAGLRAASTGDLDADILRLMLLETPEGVQAAEDICRLTGVDGVVLGPADLALALGQRIGERSAAIDEAERAVAQAAKRNSVLCMTSASSAAELIRVRDAGFNMVLLGADHALLRNAAAATVTEARARLADQPPVRL